MGALVFGNVRSGIRWFIAFLAVFVFCGILGQLWHPLPPLPGWFTTTMLVLNIVVAESVVFFLLALFAQQRRDALVALTAEHERAEELANVLPRSIAERLKNQTETIADSSAPPPSCSPMSSTSRQWQRSFAGRGRGPARPSVWPLRRPGGALRPGEDQDHRRLLHGRGGHAGATQGSREAVALLALDMLEAVRANGHDGDARGWSCIGINSGPVVAGVIGRKRFLYDLWGDAGERRRPDADARHAGASRSRARPTSCSRTTSNRSPGEPLSVRARARWRPGT